MIDKVPHHTSSTIVGDIFVRGLSKVAPQSYMKHLLDTNVISSGFHKNTTGADRVNIIFSKEDALGINPHENDPQVIIVQHDNWDIMCVLIDSGSSADVLF